METHRQAEDAAYHLLEVATPRLYFDNAFRVTGLDVTATIKEAKKLIRDREQGKKLGIRREYKCRALFPIERKQTIEDMRIAIDQKLANPFRRIIEELFWFWPEPKTDFKKDEGLSFLSEGHPLKAKMSWITKINEFRENVIPLHNLAVLHHLQALELEQKKRDGDCINISCPKCFEYFKVPANECGTIVLCINCQANLRIPSHPIGIPDDGSYLEHWRDAYEYWVRLWSCNEFWAEVSFRAKNIDDILETEIIENIRARLPEALLLVNVKLAIEYCSQNKYSDAIRQAKVIFSSKFDKNNQISAIRHATKRIISKINQQANFAESNAKGNLKNGRQEAINLLEITRSDLMCLKILDCESMKLGHSAYDAVANAAMNALVNYVNETNDFDSIIKPFEELLGIVKSGILKKRIIDNLEIIRNIARENATEASIKHIMDLCEILSNEISKAPKNDINQTRAVYDRFQKELLPMLNELRRRFGEESEEYKIAANRFASCLRNISVALHNNSQDIEKALEAISWAVDICKDTKLYASLKNDLDTCQEHAREAKKRKLFSKMKASFGWVILISVIICAIIIDKTSDNTNASAAQSTDNSYARSTTNSSIISKANVIPKTNSISSGFNSENISRKLLKNEIDTGKARLKEMEEQLRTMDRQLNEYKLEADRYKQLEQINSYNNLVSVYNALLSRRNQLFDEYDQLFNEVKAKIERYNKD